VPVMQYSDTSVSGQEQEPLYPYTRDRVQESALSCMSAVTDRRRCERSWGKACVCGMVFFVVEEVEPRKAQ
jgi:hypothetical protein